jgi:probable phosphoglycerate mutase
MSALLVILMRHGQIVQEPSADGSHRFVGNRDLPLDQTGRLQAAQAGESLRGLPIRRVLSSTLSRSVESARLAAAALDPAPLFRQDSGLGEICIGQWQGLYPAQVRQQAPGAWEARGADLAGYRPPGGESYNDVLLRAKAALAALAREASAAGDGVTLAVAHSGVNRALLCEALGLPLAHVLALPQDYGYLNLLSWDGARFTVRAVNLCPAALAQGWLKAYAPDFASP